jgi:hypothetical protein
VRQLWHRWSGIARTIFRIVVAFAVARIALGIIAIVILNDDGLAYGLRATAILAGATLIAVAVAFAVRRIPPRPRTSD